MSDYWTTYGITKPPQIVVCAACKYGPVILAGARHFDQVMHTQLREMGGAKVLRAKYGREEQGFINQFGEFLNREEAMMIVLENGQPFNIKRNGNQTNELYSEGIC
jgi:hypothetical protein